MTIVASDVEGTLTTGSMWKGMAAWLKEQGRGRDYRAYLISRLHHTLLYYTRLINPEPYKNTWLEGLLGLFGGLTLDEFVDVAEYVVERQLWPGRRDDVLAELRQHQEDGKRVILTSGGYTPLVERFAARAGFSEVIATPLELVDGRLTGKAGGPYNTGAGKVDGLRHHLEGRAPDIAYGDTLPDLPMLEMARQSVAVYPDRRLLQVAQQRGWRIITAS